VGDDGGRLTFEDRGEGGGWWTWGRGWRMGQGSYIGGRLLCHRVPQRDPVERVVGPLMLLCNAVSWEISVSLSEPTGL
jgi:hypothetical protein